MITDAKKQYHNMCFTLVGDFPLGKIQEIKFFVRDVAYTVVKFLFFFFSNERLNSEQE